MATLTIAAAARLCGCPRSTLQRAIRAGRLHLTAQHQRDPDELTRAGYLPAAGAPQPHAAGALQSRPGLEDLLRVMQRTMERLTDVIELLHQDLRQIQQERSSSPPPATPQPRAMQRPTPPSHRSPDRDAAYERMRTLQAQGQTLSQIAAQLTAEGFRTQQGRPWHKSTVSYVLRTHGR